LDHTRRKAGGCQFHKPLRDNVPVRRAAPFLPVSVMPFTFFSVSKGTKSHACDLKPAAHFTRYGHGIRCVSVKADGSDINDNRAAVKGGDPADSASLHHTVGNLSRVLCRTAPFSLREASDPSGM